jgi:ABC-type sugar transport system ATPase subunit
MLHLESVVKQYSYGKRLFGAVDLTLREGEVLSVLGGEGSGKTTLLKTIAGLEEHEGNITLDGVELKSKTDDVIMVFDDGALFPFKTVFDNLAYPLKIRGVDKVEIAKRVVFAAESFGVSACLGQRARTLTPLERRKVSLARILMRKAKLILIDDFLKGMPQEETDHLFDTVTRVLYSLAGEGAVVIYTTSSPRYAYSFGDRTMVLVDGDVKQIGTFGDTWSNPDTVWSAQAVDNRYNVIRGALSLENDKLNFDFCVFDTNYTIDVTCLKDRIAEDYIGKDVIMGWHGSEIIFTADGIKMPVSFVAKDKGYFVLEGVSGLDCFKVYSKDDKDEVVFLPDLKGVTFFDVKENSIMKRI